LIPGVILLAVAALIALDAFVPSFNDAVGGFVVLGGIGLSFTLVYLAKRANWWAIIPAGVLWTLAVVSLLGENLPEQKIGGVLFLGLGLTFVLVAILPNPIARMRWAWIPACILAVIGLLIFAAAEEMINYVWAAALVLVGSYLIWRAIRGRSA
jgi:hypothetical protein